LRGKPRAPPDEATLPATVEHVALFAALEKARQAVREGRWKHQKEVEELLRSWLEKKSDTSSATNCPGRSRSKLK
jgi:hypothetical protein